MTARRRRLSGTVESLSLSLSLSLPVLLKRCDFRLGSVDRLGRPSETSASRSGHFGRKGAAGLPGLSCALCFDRSFLLLNPQMRGWSTPRTPAEPPCQAFHRLPCRRLPSGRHRTRKLDGASAGWAPLAWFKSLRTRPSTEAPTRAVRVSCGG